MVSGESTSAVDLRARHCQPCEGGLPPLGPEEIARHLRGLRGWEQVGREIRKAFRFKDYFQTMAFVNAIAWIAHAENHHPDLEVSYNHCTVHYSTHAVGGLSENDFICAAKVDGLVPA